MTSINADFGGGTDFLNVLPSVAVPVYVDSTCNGIVSCVMGSKNYTYAGSYAGSGTSTLNGGSGIDQISVTGTGNAIVHGNDGQDFLSHSGSGAVTMYGDGGNDVLTGSSPTDALYGGGGDDLLQGIAGTYAGGDGNDQIKVLLDGVQNPAMDGGTGNDTLDLTLSGGSDVLNLSTTGASGGEVTLGLNGLDRVATGIETLAVHSGTGADQLTVGDLGSSGLTEVTLDLGPGAPDAIRVLGAPAVGTTFTVTNDSRSGHPANEVKVARSGSYTVWIDNAVRAEGDTLSVEGGSGNDTIDASGITADVIALTLSGGNGNNRLIGSPYDDVLAGGTGNDVMTGGLGLDRFSDTGGVNTLIEQATYRTGSGVVSGDVGLYNNLFVVGVVAGSGVDFSAGAVAEDLMGIFQFAQITGISGPHTYLIGDADGIVAIGGATQSAQPWTGDVTLTTPGNGDLVRVELNGATGARVHVTGAGTGNALQVFGTSLREDLVLDTIGGPRSRIRQISIGVSPTWIQSDLVSIDHAGYDLVQINTLAGGDRVAVRALIATTTISAGSGDDTVAVGSQAGVGATLTAWPNVSGIVDNIQAALTVDGGFTGVLTGQDQLTVDDTASIIDKVGKLTATTITGLAMAVAGITYTTFEDLVIALGLGNDTFTVESTHAGPARTTELTTGAGNDTVIVQSVSGPTSVNTGSGDDTVRVSSTASGTGGVLSGIGSLLTLNGGTGSADHLYVDDTASLADTIGTLTSDTIQGLSMTLNGSAPRPDLVQTVSVLNAADGRFTITVAGFGTTAALDFDAQAPVVQAALEAMLGAGP